MLNFENYFENKLFLLWLKNIIIMRNSLKRKSVLVLIFCFFSWYGNAQSGYKISIDMKNCKDTVAYLTFYQLDKTYIKDTCTNIKNGKIVFNGKEKLNKGIYSLVSQQKSIVFDFFVDENTQNLKLKGDSTSLNREVIAENSTQENDFFDYVKFIGEQNKTFATTKQQLIGLSKSDSLSKLIKTQKELDKNIRAYENQFLAKNQGSYIAEAISLRNEKQLEDVPNASNGRPDSIKVYNYYKTHYWDGVNFKDDATMRNPFFSNKLNKYFDNVVVANPDSVSVEIDRIMDKTAPGMLLHKMLLAHFTATYENHKIMGFEKVFVHMVDTYFKTGKAVGTYEDDVIERIIKRSDKLKPLLIGSMAPDLSMIRASDHDKITRMGFDNAKSSAEVTKVFYDNVDEINKLFYKLHEVKADYLILVFWDVDCGHCQKEIPKLLEEYHALQKEHNDVKVLSVYTQYEGDKYVKYIEDNKLDWINVYDGAHFNNVTEKFDIYSTPVIYILDKNKIIKAKRIGVEQIKAIIKDIEAGYKSK
jgi:thiol-disulfide isomerase/thioredoxin